MSVAVLVAEKESQIKKSQFNEVISEVISEAISKEILSHESI